MATQDSIRVRAAFPFWTGLDERDGDPLTSIDILDALHRLADQLDGLGEFAVCARAGELSSSAVQQFGVLVQEHARQVRQFADSFKDQLG